MKQLVLMRHAQADRGYEGTDITRPITLKGEKIQAKAAEELSQFCSHLDGILFSPFVRAEQSAEILHQHFPQSALIKEPALGTVFDSYTVLQHLNHYQLNSAVLVGHAPTLAIFANSVIEKPHHFSFKQSEIVVIEFSESFEFSNGKLVKNIMPSELN